MRSYFGPLRVKVWGERACFTRPECKVDRVSYPIMTPPAARGVLEAIYWHPEMFWRVLEIWNLKETGWFSHKINEVTGDKGISKEWSAMRPFDVAEHNDKGKPINRDQRHMLGLKDVKYLIVAEVVSRRPEPHTSGDEAKHRDIFQRRLNKGACAYQPFLGVREFPAYFAPADDTEESVPLPDANLGHMVATLYDLSVDPRSGESAAMRRSFQASTVDGVLKVGVGVYDGRPAP